MRILLVEDDRKLARALRTMLEEDGHEVDVAHDGERGLEMGMAGSHDVIILDVMLPLLDGVEVCRTLRANEVDVPVLMLTARTSVPDRVKGLDAGADDYLPKPFAFRELTARLRALMRRQVEARTGDRRAFAVALRRPAGERLRVIAEVKRASPSAGRRGS